MLGHIIIGVKEERRNITDASVPYWATHDCSVFTKPAARLRSAAVTHIITVCCMARTSTFILSTAASRRWWQTHDWWLFLRMKSKNGAHIYTRNRPSLGKIAPETKSLSRKDIEETEARWSSVSCERQPSSVHRASNFLSNTSNAMELLSSSVPHTHTQTYWSVPSGRY